MSADAPKRIDLTARGRLFAAGGAVAIVVVLVVAVIAIAGGGGDGGRAKPPASAAARLVPADALVYVHLSTDPGRAQTRDAAKVASSFPSYAKLRDSIVSRLQAPGCDVATKALKTADEAALAIFDTGTSSQANSLVLVDTGKAHPGARQQACGSLASTYVGTFLAIGQPESLNVAARLQKAGGRGSLAQAAGPRKELAALPEDRVADGWLSADGLRRLLAPQGGLLGAAGVLFDQATLKGAAFGLQAKGDRAELTVKSQLDPSLKRGGAEGFKPFKPTLAAAVPADAMAYLGVSNLAPALQRLLAAAGSSSKTIQSLASSLDKPLLKVFPGEAAVVLTEATPAPILTIMAYASDEAAARRTLDGLPAAVRTTLSTAVWDGKVAVSTSPKGIAAVKAGGKHLTDTENWRKAVGNHPDLLSSLLFLDFTRLLKLGEATGLDQSRAYQAARADLQKVRAIGASTIGNDSESTAEISLLLTQ
ncbi:MAG TPA: hypothetical protein VFG42_02225 [Baekduia sp.]|uniref:hypothetical protein n=1 Tax=Baekduia sp. TaxID=2600305 RepID=UPI002D77FC1A|nr:hypothetical protein [Baekduia sp.]HET6505583.1 hypothetical protein [Baekduia sp.]